MAIIIIVNEEINTKWKDTHVLTHTRTHTFERKKKSTLEREINIKQEGKQTDLKNAPSGNRTRVARMGILHDTTTPTALRIKQTHIIYLMLFGTRTVVAGDKVTYV